MATFMQWKNLYPEHKHLMWITGSEVCLIEEVLDKERESRKPQELDYEVLSGISKVSVILDALNQFAKVDSKRLVVIRDANRIRKWNKILEWTKSLLMRDSCLICVSHEKPDTKEARFEPFIKRGRFVECKPLNLEQLEEYVKSLCSIDRSALDLLIEKVSGNLYNIKNEILKLKAVTEKIQIGHVREFVKPSYEDNVVRDIFKGEKDVVVRQLPLLDKAAISRVIGSLEYKVRQLALLVPIKNKRLEPREVVDRTGIYYFMLPEYYSIVKFVDNNKILRWFKLLAQADTYYKAGIYEGILERLVSQW